MQHTLALLFHPCRQYRYRARCTLIGFHQGLVNKAALKRACAYQNGYRKAHRKSANKASAKYRTKIKVKYGNISDLNYYRYSVDQQTTKIQSKKAIYGNIKSQLATKDRGSSLQKLLQLSLRFRGRDKKTHKDKLSYNNSTLRRSLDLRGVSHHKRSAKKSTQANGAKTRNAIPPPKILY